MKKEPESFAEQLSRLRTMAQDDGETWDLSENDQAALAAVVSSHDALVAALKAAEQFLSPEIDRGPASNGWQNTVDMVKAALQLAEPPS